MTDYIIGIDGGGTSCRAAVAEPDGRVLGRGRGGPSNILTDPNHAIASIMEATEAAFREAGLDVGLVAGSSAFLGLAGTNVGDLTRYVHDRLPFRHTQIESDVLIAFEGAIGDGDGAVASLGTGTVYMARRSGEISNIGGWGFHVGDLGSGARIGQALLQEALLAHDGIHPMAGAARAVLDEFKHDPRQIVDFARLSKPGDYARFARLVFDHADLGDTQALRMLDDAVSAVNETLDVVVGLGGGKALCLLGGLAPLYAGRLAPAHRAILVEPKADALAGAVALAARNRLERGGQA